MGITTVYYDGVEFEVDYYYQPAEKEVRYDSNNTGYPGCPEYLEINGVSIRGVNVTDLCNDHGIIEKLEEKMIEMRDSYRGE